MCFCLYGPARSNNVWKSVCFCPTFNCRLLTLMKSGRPGRNLSLNHAVKGFFVVCLLPFNVKHNVQLCVSVESR